MRKVLHDSLTRKTMELIDVEDWSTHKLMSHPTRSEVNVDSFAKAGRLCRTRAMLECERTFFNNKTEKTFSESFTEVTMNLRDREKYMMILDKMTCWSTSVFNDADEWKDCKVESKHFHVKHYVENKSYERRIIHSNDNCEQSSEHTGTDEDNSDQDSDEDVRCGFQRTVENEATLKIETCPKLVIDYLIEK